jgi:hypothetical protein
MNSEKLEWEYLKELNCPKCYEYLVREGIFFRCFDCGFVISKDRLREIVEEMFNKKQDYFGRADFEELMEATE